MVDVGVEEIPTAKALALSLPPSLPLLAKELKGVGGGCRSLVIIRSKDLDLGRETSLGVESSLRRGPKGNTSSSLLSVDSSGTPAGALGLVSRMRNLSALPSMLSNHSLTLSRTAAEGCEAL